MRLSSPMRVLWLSPIALPAVAARTSVTGGLSGGWIESLRRAVKAEPGLELGVACISPVRFEPFVEDGVMYFPLASHTTSTRVGRALEAATGRDRCIDYSKQCLAAIEAFHPDIIHVHGTETSLASIVSVVSIPVVVSLQGIVREIVRHYFDGVSTGELLCDTLRLPRTLRGLGLARRYLALRRCVAGETRVLEEGRYFTGRTEFDREVLRRSNPHAVYFHCDHVLRPEFYTAQPQSPRQDNVIYCAGGRAPYKGIDVALNATAQLVQRGWSDVRLRVGGPVLDSDVGRIMRRRERTLGLTGRVEWLGSLSTVEIVRELTACSVCLIPSHIDNSPNTLSEAMLCAAPCVAAATGGVPSMVVEGDTGLLFTPGDSTGAADCLEQALAHPDYSLSLGKRACVIARVRHDPARIREATLSMYVEIIHSRGQGFIRGGNE